MTRDNLVGKRLTFVSLTPESVQVEAVGGAPDVVEAAESDDSEDESGSMRLRGRLLSDNELGLAKDGYGLPVAVYVGVGVFGSETIRSARLLRFHNRSDVITGGAESGAVTISRTEDGYVWEAALDENDPDAVSAFAKVRNRTLPGSSAGFSVLEGEWKTAKELGLSGMRGLEDDDDVAQVTAGNVYEVSLVDMGAFPSSSANVFGAESTKNIGRANVSASVVDEAGSDVFRFRRFTF